MVNIAVLGHGTVGSGVVNVLNNDKGNIETKTGKKINVKYILERPDLPENLKTDKMIFDYNTILMDDDIKIVVEVIGGIEPCFTYVKQALASGKSVVTSNKELVEKHGSDLIGIAALNNVNFLFEASVGGGIPLLRPMNTGFTGDEIININGILNGTTNYILTKMANENESFDTALADAQAKGYAELHPEADVHGIDACRKLAILLSLATGKIAHYGDIYLKGITEVSPIDLEYAKQLHYKLKLVAHGKLIGEKAEAFVCPVMVSSNTPLYGVDDVFNAVMVTGKITGDTMFYGQGAGKFPTASAVISDVVECAKHPHTGIIKPWAGKLEILPFDQTIVKELVRVKYTNKEEAVAAIKNSFSGIVIIEICRDEFGFIIEGLTQHEITAALNNLKNCCEPLNRLPII